MFSENVKKSLDVVLKVTEIKTDIEKVHEQAICGKFDNSSKLGKPEQFQYLKKSLKRT